MHHGTFLLVLLLLGCVTISAGADIPSVFPFHDEIRDPLKVVNRLYREAIEKGDTNGDWGVPAHFKKVLKKDWNKVPLLNAVHRVEDLQPGSLVRFRCMIQSVVNPEFFIGALTGKDPVTGEDVPISCKFRDSVPPTVEDFPDATDDVIARGMLERLPAMCIPVPGESAWVNQDSIACQDLMPELETPRKSRGGAKRGQPDEAQDQTATEEGKTEGKEERRGLQLRGVRTTPRQGDKAKGRRNEAEEGLEKATDGTDRGKERQAVLEDGDTVLEEAREDDDEHGEGESAAEQYGRQEQDNVEEEQDNVQGAENRTVEVGGAKIVFPSEDVANSVRAAQSFLRKVEPEAPVEASPKKERLPKGAEEREEGRGAPRWALGKDGLWTVDDGLRVLAKFYDIDREELKMMSVVEVAGVLGMDPVNSVFSGDYTREYPNGITDNDFPSPNMIPHSLMPRLHVLCYRKLSAFNELAYHPFISEGFVTPSPRGMQSLIDARSNVPQLRQRVLELLADACGGDDLLAEYILCAIIAKAVNRPEPGMVVGKFALSVLEWNSMGGADGEREREREGGGSTTAGLCEVLAALLPLFRNLTVTADYLNTTPMIPRKDYNLEFLSLTPIQVPESCVLLFDEHPISDDALTYEGATAMGALKNLVLFQTMGVDYEFFASEVDMDCPVIVVSRSRKSKLDHGSDCTVPHRPRHPPCLPRGPAATILQDAELLELCRGYLAWLRLLKWDLGDDMGEYVSMDWVAARREDAKKPQEDRELHNDLFASWMTLARLLSISHGEEKLTEQAWQRMRELEARRMARRNPE